MPVATVEDVIGMMQNIQARIAALENKTCVGLQARVDVIKPDLAEFQRAAGKREAFTLKARRALALEEGDARTPRPMRRELLALWLL